MSEIMKIEGKPVVNYIYFLGEKVTDEKIKAPTEMKADQKFTQWISTNTPYRSISAYAKYVGYFTGYETNDGTIYVNGNGDELHKNSEYVSFGGDILSFKDVVEYFPEDDLDEALYGKKEIDEFFSLCNKLGLKTFGDLKDFADNNKNRIIVNNLLKDYDSTMSTDAFFETLRDRVKEMPSDEFKYDDPLNVIKNRNRNESLDGINAKNSIEVEVKSGINGDGFKVIVKDTDGSIIEQEDFSYGYNASYNKSWADKDKPFVTDIIDSYLSKYNLTRDDLILTKGKNVFKDRDISDETITRFKTDYLSESKKLTEGHEQYDYKGFSIDLDDDQFHNIKRHGSGNIAVEVKIGDTVYATVNGYDAAEEWIDKNGQKILNEIEAEKKRKEEEELKRNEKEKLLIDMLNRINSKNDFYDFRKDSDPGISKSVHLDKEHLGKLLRLGSAGNYKGAIPVDTDIEGIDLFANIYDVGVLGYDLEYGVGAFGDFDSLDRAFNNDAYVFIFRNITFNNREAADEWLIKLINDADTIVTDLIDEEWKDSGFENYDSIFESFNQEGSKLIPEDMSAAEDIRADILHSISTTAKFSPIETKAADEKAFYSVTPIDGDTGRKIELLIGERYDNVEMIPYTEDWSEELYSYEGSDLIQVEIKIYL